MREVKVLKGKRGKTESGQRGRERRGGAVYVKKGARPGPQLLLWVSVDLRLEQKPFSESRLNPSSRFRVLILGKQGKEGWHGSSPRGCLDGVRWTQRTGLESRA